MKLYVGYCENCDSGVVSRIQKTTEQSSFAHSLEKRGDHIGSHIHVVTIVELDIDEGAQRKITVPSQELMR